AQLLALTAATCGRDVATKHAVSALGRDRPAAVPPYVQEATLPAPGTHPPCAIGASTSTDSATTTTSPRCWAPLVSRACTPLPRPARRYCRGSPSFGPAPSRAPEGPRSPIRPRSPSRFDRWRRYQCV